MPVPSVRRTPAAGLLAFALAALALAACASSSSRGPIDDTNDNMARTTRIEGAGGTIQLRSMTGTTATSESAVPAAPARAFAALPVVYEALGVPVNTVMSDAATFGVREMRMPRRLGKVALSRYVDCGTGSTGTANADGYAVTMTVLSRVTPGTTPTSSNVVTQLVATARPITVSGNTIQCESTGRLERAINEQLAVEAAR